MSFELSTTLPELPKRGRIDRAETTFSSALVESVKAKLGIREPVRPEWDKVPVVTPLQAYRAGPFALFASGAWGYDANESGTASPAPPTDTAPADAAGPSISDEEAINIAQGWLEKAGLYPPDSVASSVFSKGADVSVYFGSAKGSPLAAADDPPGIWVLIRSREIIAATGMWPKSSSPAGDVPLRTAREAWADLQAGTGAVVGTVRPVDADLNSHMTIHSVSLDRVLIRSLENRWYYIPVVLFEGEIKDTKGQGHKAIAYVTAVKPTPGQAGYELKAGFPQFPAKLPLVQINRPQKQLSHAWQPDTPIQTFRVPTTESVTEAAVRVAAAAGVDSELIGKPELRWSPTEIFASVPVSWNGLPAIQTIGDPQQVPAVWIRFSLDGGLLSVTLHGTVAQSTGDPVPLMSPEEAWRQVEAGGGIVKVIHEREFPNAHFAAHRTTIDRVELAYNVDPAAWAEGQPAQPSYFFWGKAIVGEEFTEQDVVVIIPAIRP